MNQNKYFLLYANCILVQGAKRSIICDLQKGSYVFVPNTLAEILGENRNQSISSLKSKFPLLKDELDNCFATLIKHDLGHFSNTPLNFPSLNLNYATPFKINDCILELSEINYKNINYILKSLTNLGCQVLELRGYDCFSLVKLERILNLVKKTRIRSVEVYLKQSNKDKIEDYLKFAYNGIIRLFVIHSSSYSIPEGLKNTSIVFTKQSISSSNCCGNISEDYFRINLPAFSESIKYNNCLNKKVSISSDGYIKNCPSLNKIFGQVKKNSIEKVVESDSFKKLWKVKKDLISICKDCEFRYICGDCRAFVNNVYEKPKKCKYNPYTTLYEE